jgi:ferredoxin-NADP reductase
MENHPVKIKSIQLITHDVLKIVVEKPLHYNFIPGQATEVAINKDGWKDKKRPFTFTSLPVNDFLQFTIKTYPEHKGVTNELLQLKKDDELILHDVFGAIAYKGEGLFIAGGAGVTPFISIFRYLQSKDEIGGNKLIFANKMKDDIILEKEFKSLLGDNFINILSDEKTDEYAYGQITESFLNTNIDCIDRQFYLCGPPPMMEAVQKQLTNLGIRKEAITIEKF